jgi:Helicase conserved C-terminal domain
MHGGFSDIEQEKIVERFSLADEPVRVLLTGDVASEGVNMHRQCHHLIRYDLPWSLIRIEQRITREFTARREEDRLVKDLLAGKTADESIDAASAVDDFLADLLAGVGDQPGGAEPPRADVPELPQKN